MASAASTKAAASASTGSDIDPALPTLTKISNASP
jgi:hypothetical protein